MKSVGYQVMHRRLSEIVNADRVDAMKLIPKSHESGALVAQLDSAMLKLVNDTLRACGVAVDNAESESNSAVVSRFVTSLVFKPIDAERRKFDAAVMESDMEELRRLEARIAEFTAQAAELRAKLGSAAPELGEDDESDEEAAIALAQLETRKLWKQSPGKR